MTFIPSLHGLRGLSAILVLLYHWDGSFPALGRYLDDLMVGQVVFFFIRLGWIGVDWFFVLSGYLLSAQYWGMHLDLKSILNFYIRRIGRIYPGVWVHLIGLIIILIFLGFPIKLDWQGFVGNFLLWVAPIPSGVQPLNAVFWTLPIELSFYITLPLWIYCSRIIGVSKTVFLCMVITLVWRLSINYAVLNGVEYFNIYYMRHALPGLLFVFMAGFFLNHPRINYKLINIGMKHGNFKIAILLIFYIVWLWVLVQRRSQVDRYDLVLVLWELIAAVIITGMVGLLLKPPILFKWIQLQSMVWLGTISFGLYLWHFPIFRIMHKLAPLFFATPLGSFLALLIGFSLTLLCAWASFRWVEGPFVKWINAKLFNFTQLRGGQC